MVLHLLQYMHMYMYVETRPPMPTPRWCGWWRAARQDAITNSMQRRRLQASATTANICRHITPVHCTARVRSRRTHVCHGSWSCMLDGDVDGAHPVGALRSIVVQCMSRARACTLSCTLQTKLTHPVEHISRRILAELVAPRCGWRLQSSRGGLSQPSGWGHPDRRRGGPLQGCATQAAQAAQSRVRREESMRARWACVTV